MSDWKRSLSLSFSPHTACVSVPPILAVFGIKRIGNEYVKKSAVLTEEIIFYEANLCQPFVKLIRQGQQICSPQCR